MKNFSNIRHGKFIEEFVQPQVNAHGVVQVGNHLNQFVTFENANKYVQLLVDSDNDIGIKSGADALRGRLVEDIVVYLLREVFELNRLPYTVTNGAAGIDTLKIVNETHGISKKFDVDILVKKNECDDRLFLLSCKGTSRERIGQYMNNLFLMDDRLIATKYGGRYYLDFARRGVKVKYGFVCMDWAVGKDFVLKTAAGNVRKTGKQTEVYLINDDYYISGGLTVLNDLENLYGIINFGELVGKISKFLETRE